MGGCVSVRFFLLPRAEGLLESTARSGAKATPGGLRVAAVDAKGARRQSQAVPGQEEKPLATGIEADTARADLIHRTRSKTVPSAFI